MWLAADSFGEFEAFLVQFSRGPKKRYATVEAGLKVVGGGDEGQISWGDAKMSFVATLFASKTGKEGGHSDKKYNVSLIGVKPVIGSHKKQHKERSQGRHVALASLGARSAGL